MPVSETPSSEILLLMITAGSREEADAIGNALLEARLAACVNIASDVRSLYWWKGAREAADEWLLIAKTRRSLFPEVLKQVRAVHSYEVFELVGLPVIEANPDY